MRAESVPVVSVPDAGAAPAAAAAPWALYDALLADIPDATTAESFSAGLHWFAVRSRGALGLAMAPCERPATPSLAGRVAGTRLAELAALSKSWNAADASLGVAALNAGLNEPSRVLGWSASPCYECHLGANAFTTLLPRVSGCEVAVIGHFRGLEALARECRLHILERRPGAGDLPDPACEWVLPRADFVFITATTLINKTLPRLLQLCPGAFVSLVGPSTPLSARWFDLGVDLIAGLLVDDRDGVERIAREGGNHAFFDAGTRMIQIERRRGADERPRS